MNKYNKFKKFYSTHTGKILKKFIQEEISTYLQYDEKTNILTLGHNILSENDYTSLYCISNTAHINFENENFRITIKHSELPFANDFVDKILIFNYLEYCKKPILLFKELWRILSPNGVIILVVPNKNSLWKINDLSIFRHCRMFSLYEILRILNKNSFNVLRISSRIFINPNSHILTPNMTNSLDIIASKWLIPFGGFLFIEAKKNMYNMIYENRLSNDFVSLNEI